MDWQTSGDTLPSTFITDEQVRSVAGKPPASGAWRDGDPEGDRLFANLGPLDFELGGHLPHTAISSRPV